MSHLGVAPLHLRAERPECQCRLPPPLLRSPPPCQPCNLCGAYTPTANLQAIRRTQSAGMNRRAPTASASVMSRRSAPPFSRDMVCDTLRSLDRQIGVPAREFNPRTVLQDINRTETFSSESPSASVYHSIPTSPARGTSLSAVDSLAQIPGGGAFTQVFDICIVLTRFLIPSTSQAGAVVSHDCHASPVPALSSRIERTKSISSGRSCTAPNHSIPRSRAPSSAGNPGTSNQPFKHRRSISRASVSKSDVSAYSSARNIRNGKPQSRKQTIGTQIFGVSTRSPSHSNSRTPLRKRPLENAGDPSDDLQSLGGVHSSSTAASQWDQTLDESRRSLSKIPIHQDFITSPHLMGIVDAAIEKYEAKAVEHTYFPEVSQYFLYLD